MIRLKNDVILGYNCENPFTVIKETLLIFKEELKYSIPKLILTWDHKITSTCNDILLSVYREENNGK